MNNEREKFEAWFVRNIPDDIRDNALLALRQSEREDGNYRQPIMQAFWEGWQARAASASETGAEGATEDHECVYENGDGTCRQCAELAKRAKQRFGYARKIDYRVTGQEPDDHELCSSDAPGAFPLYRSPAMAVEAVAIPAGWKLVPIEPTEEMITAGIAKGDAEFYGDALVRAEVRSDYRAMVAAYVPPLEERGPCICQEDLGNPGGTCAWKNGHAPCAAPQPAQADAQDQVADARECGEPSRPLSDFERTVLEYIAFNDGFDPTRFRAQAMLDGVEPSSEAFRPVRHSWVTTGMKIDPAGSWVLASEGRAGVTDAARDVLAERQRQVEKEGWTPEHDDQHPGAMAKAAATYAAHAGAAEGLPHTVFPEVYRSVLSREVSSAWPWDVEWWKPTTPRRDLVKAGALILAEIERLDRAKGE